MRIVHCHTNGDTAYDIHDFVAYQQYFDTIADYAVVVVECACPCVVATALYVALHRPITIVLKRPDITIADDFKVTAVVCAQGIQYVDMAYGTDTAQVILFSSGTTGKPKIMRHTIKSLAYKIIEKPHSVWLCAYQLGTFASVQVLLSAIKSGTMLVYAHALAAQKMAALIKKYVITHASGTPSFWRLLLPYMQGANSVQSITLGGEIADTATLQNLKNMCPQAIISHVYASSELGSIFAVRDCKAGFPAVWLNADKAGCILQIRDDVLWIHSNRAMVGYGNAPISLDADGFFCTGDRVEVVGDRVLFLGREHGIINIGGTKVSVEKIETELLQCPFVADCMVYGIKNPILGYILAAKIITSDEQAVQVYMDNTFSGVFKPCVIDFVREIPYTHAGKKSRNI